MPADPAMQAGLVDDSEREYPESLIRADYEHCHPGETLADLKHRARFSKGDNGLLRYWMAVAKRRAATSGRPQAAAVSPVAAE